MKIDLQMIITGIIGIVAFIFVVRTFYKQFRHPDINTKCESCELKNNSNISS